MTKILIITLYCGESGYDACKKSVVGQTYDNAIDHIFIENLPNLEAHKVCYQTIMDQADKYDLFIKLDADMAFTRESAVEDIVNYWHDQNNPDHMVFAVHDYLSNQNIIGIHVFSNNCRWELNNHNPLFVDPNPTHTGQRTKTYSQPAPFASHLRNPTDAEAYSYGLHRGIKTFQWGRRNASIHGLGALRTLQHVAEHYKQSGNEKALFALIGAEYARTHTTDIQYDYKSNNKIEKQPIGFWLSPTRVKLYWLLMTFPRVLPSYLWSNIFCREGG